MLTLKIVPQQIKWSNHVQYYDLLCANELFHVFPQDAKSTYCLWQYTAITLCSLTQMKKNIVFTLK